MKLRLATRGSKLALTQTRAVVAILCKANPHLEFEEVIIKTLGDRVTDVPLFKVGGQGLFIKEIEEALLDGRADLAVHSLKDMPHKLGDGLALAAVSAREDPRDVLVTRDGRGFDALSKGSRIGTSSLRRRAQLHSLRSDLVFSDLRGNLDTRLRKLDEGEIDAIVLAAAGLRRLGLAARISEPFPVVRMTPAACQGLLGIECREKDLGKLTPILAVIEDAAGRASAIAERAFLARLQGGCQVPLAVHARHAANDLIVDGFLGDPDGSERLRAEKRGPVTEADRLGIDCALELIAQGAEAILSRITRQGASHAPK
ncbi:MAG: hydroxymethylbilane synthase [Candidatus Riflebacteria bacterium]|nr:hydroxymethylbilane synthase [Candidatus Riflebacteria bacterium]